MHSHSGVGERGMCNRGERKPLAAEGVGRGVHRPRDTRRRKGNIKHPKCINFSVSGKTVGPKKPEHLDHDYCAISVNSLPNSICAFYPFLCILHPLSRCSGRHAWCLITWVFNSSLSLCVFQHWRYPIFYLNIDFVISYFVIIILKLRYMHLHSEIQYNHLN